MIQLAKPLFYVTALLSLIAIVGMYLAFRTGTQSATQDGPVVTIADHSVIDGKEVSALVAASPQAFKDLNEAMYQNAKDMEAPGSTVRDEDFRFPISCCFINPGTHCRILSRRFYKKYKDWHATEPTERVDICEVLVLDGILAGKKVWIQKDGLSTPGQ
jgi:hypothetical protein